ncbi:hypothetical protein PUN28_002726 [Cardiocondyla obscurior]|uniref:Uncharacterized protein n=1 Tax=Cardiocondyla obscurior TaxID=286306 RepID=A0AAW2GVU3_9HYME
MRNYIYWDVVSRDVSTSTFHPLSPRKLKIIILLTFQNILPVGMSAASLTALLSHRVRHDRLECTNEELMMRTVIGHGSRMTDRPTMIYRRLTDFRR